MYSYSTYSLSVVLKGEDISVLAESAYIVSCRCALYGKKHLEFARALEDVGRYRAAKEAKGTGS